MSERVRELLRDRFEPRRTVLRGTITSAPLIDGRSAGYVLATVAGQGGMKVRCNPDQQPPLAPGDTIECQAYGSPSATWYYALNRTAGARTDAGIWEFTQDTQYGGDLYAPGDVLMGSTLPGKSNWWYVYEQGQWRVRAGVNLRGCIGNLQGTFGYTEQTFGQAWGDPAGDWLGIDETHGIRMMRAGAMLAQWHEEEIRLGEPGHPQLRLLPDAIDFLGADGTVQAGFDGLTRTIYGFDRWGQPLGPALEIGPTDEGRWGLWLRGRDNVPFAALVSGSEADPDNVFFRVGAQAASQYLEFSGGNLTVSGVINAREGGSIAGWEITVDQLRGAGSAVVLDSDGIVVVNNQAGLHGTDASGLRIWAGASLANRANGTFRVYDNGDVYATSVKSISGSGSASGTTGIAIFENTGTGPAIHAIGGIYVDGTMGDGNTIYCGGTIEASTPVGGGIGVYASAETGVKTTGDIGLDASGTTVAVFLRSGSLNANLQNITNVNRLYLGGTTCYLHLSGSDVYWWNGSTDVKLN